MNGTKKISSYSCSVVANAKSSPGSNLTVKLRAKRKNTFQLYSSFQACPEAIIKRSLELPHCIFLIKW